MSNDRNVAIKGGAWMSLSTAVTMFTQFLRLVILTRFLEKSDFGVVSIVNMVVGLCLTFTDLGFATSIMYKKNISDKEFSTLFCIQLCLFAIIYIVGFMLSPLVASFYNEEVLESLIPLAGLAILLQSFGKLYDSVLQKHYQFRFLAITTILTNVLSLILALFLAANGYGVYSLVLSTLFQVTLLNLCEFVKGLQYQKIVLQIGIKETWPLVKIGLYQTGTNVLDYLSYKMDVMIIGKLLGVEILGVYDLAKELVVKFTGLIRTIVSKVALPILANNNNDDETVKIRFLQITKIIATISIPICIALCIFSKETVLILYGQKYFEATGIVSIFAIISIISSISCFIDMLGIAKGRTDLNFKNTVYRIIITTPMIILTSHISINAVIWGQLITSFITFFVFWNVVTMKTYPMTLKAYFMQFGKYLIVTSLVGFFTFIIKTLLPDIFPNTILSAVIFFLIYILLFAISAKMWLKEDLSYIIGMIPMRRSKS